MRALARGFSYRLAQRMREHARIAHTMKSFATRNVACGGSMAIILGSLLTVLGLRTVALGQIGPPPVEVVIDFDLIGPQEYHPILLNRPFVELPQGFTDRLITLDPASQSKGDLS